MLLAAAPDLKIPVAGTLARTTFAWAIGGVKEQDQPNGPLVTDIAIERQV